MAVVGLAAGREAALRVIRISGPGSLLQKPRMPMKHGLAGTEAKADIEDDDDRSEAGSIESEVREDVFHDVSRVWAGPLRAIPMAAGRALDAKHPFSLRQGISRQAYSEVLLIMPMIRTGSYDEDECVDRAASDSTERLPR